MKQINDILKEFPEESRHLVEAVWRALPLERQEHLLTLLPVLPGQPGKVQKLFELAREQIQMSFGDRQQVAIVGPANVGKSTLYNQLVANPANQAEVSPVPGTTRANQAADAGPFTVVDTPGADAVGPIGQRERALALEAAAQADVLIILFDAVQGIKQTEQALFEALEALRKPYLVVLNKMDLVPRRQRGAVVKKAAENLAIVPEAIIPVSAKHGNNLEDVVLAIVKAEPALIAALGQGLPAYRWQLAWRVISGAASTASLIALTPLPFLDFIPLVAVQISLILGVARIYNYRITPGRAREIASVFGAGFLARTLFYELAKFGGPPTWLLAAAVAAGTTVAIGYSAILWFERGERLTREARQRISRIIAEQLVDTLKSLGQRKPSRKQLSQRIRETLEQSPLAKGREELDQATQER